MYSLTPQQEARELLRDALRHVAIHSPSKLARRAADRALHELNGINVGRAIRAADGCPSQLSLANEAWNARLHGGYDVTA